MLSETQIIEKFNENLKIKKNIKKKEDILLDIFYNTKDKTHEFSEIKILILNIPCNGFGDIVFAIKISNYLREWYNVKLTIASTNTENFIKIGENPNNLVRLISNNSQTQTNLECKQFKNLTFEKKIDVHDLIFVAPVPSEKDNNIYDVKKLIKYANKFNTYFFSEYNYGANYDFPTGIGGGGTRYGLLLNNIDSKNLKRIEGIDNEYAVVYISDNMVRAETCLLSFIEMISKKYSANKNFDIIVPNWVIEDCIEYDGKWEKRQKCQNLKNIMIKLLSKYYSNIDIIGKDKVRKSILIDKVNKVNNLITLRGDIYPVKNEQMLGLIKYSVKDILLTGDQSITDALSCCDNKNIFYQIAPWKESFGKDLAYKLSNKYLLKKSTSCGTLKALKYNGNYKEFINDWDFRKLAKSKMDAILMYSKTRKSSKIIKYLESLIFHTRNLSSLKKKINLLCK